MAIQVDDARKWFDPFASDTLVGDEAWPTPTLPQLARQIEHRIRVRLGSRLSDLSVDVVDDGIVLSGRCQTYYTKQLAQHAAQGVLEDQPLHNDIEVVLGG